MDYTIPGEEDIADAVMQLQLHRAGIPSGIKVEHLQMFHHAANQEEDLDPRN